MMLFSGWRCFESEQVFLTRANISRPLYSPWHRNAFMKSLEAFQYCKPCIVCWLPGFTGRGIFYVMPVDEKTASIITQVHFSFLPLTNHSLTGHLCPHGARCVVGCCHISALLTEYLLHREHPELIDMRVADYEALQYNAKTPHCRRIAFFPHGYSLA